MTITRADLQVGQDITVLEAVVRAAEMIATQVLVQVVI